MKGETLSEPAASRSALDGETLTSFNVRVDPRRPELAAAMRLDPHASSRIMCAESVLYFI